MQARLGLRRVEAVKDISSLSLLSSIRNQGVYDAPSAELFRVCFFGRRLRGKRASLDCAIDSHVSAVIYYDDEGGNLTLTQVLLLQSELSAATLAAPNRRFERPRLPEPLDMLGCSTPRSQLSFRER